MTLRRALRRDASRSVLIVASTVYARLRIRANRQATLDEGMRDAAAPGGGNEIRAVCGNRSAEVCRGSPDRALGWPCNREREGHRRAKRRNSLDRKRTELCSDEGYVRGRRRALPPVAFSFPAGRRRRPPGSLASLPRRSSRRPPRRHLPSAAERPGRKSLGAGCCRRYPGAPTPAASPPAPAGLTIDVRAAAICHPEADAHRDRDDRGPLPGIRRVLALAALSQPLRRGRRRPRDHRDDAGGDARPALADAADGGRPPADPASR